MCLGYLDRSAPLPAESIPLRTGHFPRYRRGCMTRRGTRSPMPSGQPAADWRRRPHFQEQGRIQLAMSVGQLPADLRQRGGSQQAQAASDPKRRPHQLPSGRHGLLRSFVAANQRERIMAAVGQAAAEVGYAEMSVEAIVARAGVSRRTFYEHFKNKEDAFLAAYDAVVRQQARQIRRAYFDETTVQARLRAGIRAYLDFTAKDRD